ncbi:MAG: hypothetical protein WC724_02860 [Candidatus Paceibacterota bacterium]
MFYFLRSLWRSFKFGHLIPLWNSFRVLTSNDPWAGSCGYREANLRWYLDIIARGMSERGAIVKTRFNPEKKVAEFFLVSTGEVIARVLLRNDYRGFEYLFLYVDLSEKPIFLAKQERPEILIKRGLPTFRINLMDLKYF